MFRHMHLIPLLKEKTDVYFLLMKILPFLIYLLTGLIIYLSYKIKNSKLEMKWLIAILRFSLPIFPWVYLDKFFYYSQHYLIAKMEIVMYL